MDVIERSMPPEASTYSVGATGDGTTLTGYFAVFNQWAEIDSVQEGHFMERIAPGAFRNTLASDPIRVLFQHGKDPQIGDKVLGPISVLEEDAQGARFEVPLLDTSYNRDLLPGLRAGLYGSSFRFSVAKQDFNHRAKASDYNPDGLPERTIQEARVFEFGPVTFPAYPGATAGLRSLTGTDDSRWSADQLDQLIEDIDLLLYA